MFSVHSTGIVGAGYDALCEILELRFDGDGRAYRYHAVPEHVWYDMREAPSMDVYFRKYIMGRYTEEVQA